jgi:biofilm PGA synthesis N-glycosyltransferase PgaC
MEDEVVGKTSAAPKEMFEASSGMHVSFEVPPPEEPRWYLTVNQKFTISVVFAFIWLGFSIWISIPWVHGLATHISLAAAIIIVTLLAFLPGFIVSLLFAALILDRQPPLKVSSPRVPVTILIAARNEEAAIEGTLESIAEQDYEGELKVFLIDNGSSDDTIKLARAAAAATDLRLEIFEESQPGKNFALNLGLSRVTTELVVTVDADTLLQRSAVRLLVARLESSPAEVAAVAGCVLVRNTRHTFWTRIQTWDYFLGIASVKRMQGLFQTTLVAQGAFSLYRTDCLREVEGWPDAIGEDIVLTWRMMETGARVYFEPLAVSFTNAPETFQVFARQRSRWARGMIEGLRMVPPWRQQHGLAKVFTALDIAIPLLDTAYVFLWIPGLVLACFGYFWIVGPMTIAVLPLTIGVYAMLFHFQNTRVFKPLGLTVRRSRRSFVLFVIFYQVFMSTFSVIGYTQELTRRRRKWK